MKMLRATLIVLVLMLLSTLPCRAQSDSRRDTRSAFTADRAVLAIGTDTSTTTQIVVDRDATGKPRSVVIDGIQYVLITVEEKRDVLKIAAELDRQKRLVAETTQALSECKSIISKQDERFGLLQQNQIDLRSEVALLRQSFDEAMKMRSTTPKTNWFINFLDHPITKRTASYALPFLADLIVKR